MYINLKKTKETKIGYPYNQPYYCDDEIIDKTYRKRNCLLKCQNKLFVIYISGIKHHNLQ